RDAGSGQAAHQRPQQSLEAGFELVDRQDGWARRARGRATGGILPIGPGAPAHALPSIAASGRRYRLVHPRGLSGDAHLQSGASHRAMSIQTDDFAPAPPRVVSAAPASPNEEAIERVLRPKLLDEYVGQAKVREQLEIFIGAARKRREPLDHVLLFGPPGLGKTTLSHIVAAELGVNLRQTSGPVLEKPKDLA